MKEIRTASLGAATRPEFFRLPKAGQPDPFFGLPRSRFYELEEAGAIHLTRLHKDGKTRGITLVPYDQLRDYLRSLSLKQKQNETA
jgi:hypothetical protein